MTRLTTKYADAVARYTAGATIDALAAHYGVTRQSIHAALRARQCPFRPRGRRAQAQIAAENPTHATEPQAEAPRHDD